MSEQTIITIGYAVNALFFVWMIARVKSIKYIHRCDVCTWDLKGEPVLVKEGITWDKAWHRPKFALWQIVVLLALGTVPYLAAVIYLVVTEFTISCIEDGFHYIEKTGFTKKYEAFTALIKRPFVLFFNFMNKEI